MLEKILSFLQGGILQPLSFTTYGMGARVSAIVDILLVTILLTVLFRFLRRTRATNILVGFIFVGLGIVVARILNLTTMNLVLSVFFVLLLFAIPFLFQPELRRGLERLGRKGPFWRTNARALDDETIRVLAEAVEELQSRKHGALIVLEKQTGLSEFIDNGVAVDAKVGTELLTTIFYPGSALHDGAVIIRAGFISAAACTLPLADGQTVGRLGTRHRAALGISESSDAVAIVVSEERGTVSVAVDGKLYKVATAHDLNHLLRKLG
jgi:diadenylate cyclase